jgi:signal transduction histidine kinase
VLAERERLAREIHDTLAQGFTSVVVLLELAESEVDTDPAAARQRLATARATARQNLAEARALVAALSPADLQVAPLPEAIGRLVDRFGAETGLAARLSVSGEPRSLPANEEVVLLRSAQEALANVRKHAGAGRVEVSLDSTGTRTSLAVADDGAGFDPAAPTGGYGLAGMRRRVEEIGGTLSIHSGPGGTRVEVRC